MCRSLWLPGTQKRTKENSLASWSLQRGWEGGQSEYINSVSGVEKAQALKGIHSMCLAICNFLKSLLDAS